MNTLLTKKDGGLSGVCQGVITYSGQHSYSAAERLGIMACLVSIMILLSSCTIVYIENCQVYISENDSLVKVNAATAEDQTTPISNTAEYALRKNENIPENAEKKD